MPSPIRVAAYVDLRSTTRQPTGVDKHIARMVQGLVGIRRSKQGKSDPRKLLIDPMSVELLPASGGEFVPFNARLILLREAIFSVTRSLRQALISSRVTLL